MTKTISAYATALDDRFTDEVIDLIREEVGLPAGYAEGMARAMLHSATGYALDSELGVEGLGMFYGHLVDDVLDLEYWDQDDAADIAVWYAELIREGAYWHITANNGESPVTVMERVGATIFRDIAVIIAGAVEERLEVEAAA